MLKKQLTVLFALYLPSAGNGGVRAKGSCQAEGGALGR